MLLAKTGFLQDAPRCPPGEKSVSPARRGGLACVRYELAEQMNCACAMGGNMKTLTTLIIAASMFPFLAGCEKQRLDAQVKELCAKDGGVKVYVQVKLPSERFDQWGNVQIPPKEKVRVDDNFYYELNTTYIRKGDPEIWRSHFRVIRKSDSKLLGESVSYSRRGGDPPGPWHASSFECPDINTQSSMSKLIFIKE